MADVLLHDGSEVFRSGGGRSVLLGSDNHSDHSSVLLTLRNEEGKVVCTYVCVLISMPCPGELPRTFIDYL